MADDTMRQRMEKSTRNLRHGLGEMVNASPLIGAARAMGRVGKEIIERTPEPIRKYGRRLRQETAELLGSRPGRQRQRIRAHGRRTQANRRARRSGR